MFAMGLPLSQKGSCVGSVRYPAGGQAGDWKKANICMTPEASISQETVYVYLPSEISYGTFNITDYHAA